MKIVRVSFSVGGSRFYTDSPCNVDKSDEDNCDIALKSIITSFEKESVMSIMMMGEGRTIFESKEDEKGKHDPFYNARPALLNTKQVALVTVDGVGIYEIEAAVKSKSE